MRTSNVDHQPIAEARRVGPCWRIVVIGSTGSGKSTLARALALRLGVTHVELDALHWEPNWTEAPSDVFRDRVDAATRDSGWAVSGNSSQVRDIIWGRAGTVVWLDLPFRVVALRLARRTFRRIITREELWNGNRERLWVQLATRDSLFLWLLKTYWRRRREYPILFRQPEYAHLTIVHLRSTAEARRYVESVSATAVPAS